MQITQEDNRGRKNIKDLVQPKRKFCFGYINGAEL